jgi:hypothetical protein
VTRRLIADGELRERLAHRAIERAGAFETARFEDRLRELVAHVVEPRPAAGQPGS